MRATWLPGLAGTGGRAKGSVIGVERWEAAARAEKHVADRGLVNVEVRTGDGRDTGLGRETFDLVTSRLVLVNVPRPEELVAEAVAMAKPGGVVAYHEAVWPVHTYDPPLDAWGLSRTAARQTTISALGEPPWPHPGPLAPVRSGFLPDMRAVGAWPSVLVGHRP